MNQLYPWLKLPHREYLVSISYAALKPLERLALLELAMYAHTQPNNALPDNDKALAGWAGMSLNQWLKVKANVFTEWLLVDGFWVLPQWFVIEQPPKDNAQANQKSNATEKQQRNAERQKRYRERNANRNDVTQDDVTHNADSNATVTHSNVTHNATVTHNERNESVTNGGIKGGDLDLDLDLDKDLEEEQEVKTKTSRDASVCDARFDLFWKNYPRKEKKQDAIKSWKKIKPNETLFNEILSAIDQQKTWASWLSGYIPHATTWLNGKRWEDEQPRQQNIVPLTNRPNSQSWQSKEDERKAFNKAAQEEFLRSFNSDNVIDGVSRHVG